MTKDYTINIKLGFRFHTLRSNARNWRRSVYFSLKECGPSAVIHRFLLFLNYKSDMALVNRENENNLQNIDYSNRINNIRAAYLPSRGTYEAAKLLDDDFSVWIEPNFHI